MHSALGIDGARGGWVIADGPTEPGDPPTLRFVTSLDDVFDRIRIERPIVAIDIPVGLPAGEPRPTDALARRRLGDRRSTFFPTPVRAVLACSGYDEANAESRRVSGRGLSKQAWNLVPKIREVDALWRDDLDELVFEAHPESSFAEMGGTPVRRPKSTAGGRRTDLPTSPQPAKLLAVVPKNAGV